MIVPPGTVLRSSKRRNIYRQVVDMRQLASKVVYQANYQGRWRPPIKISLDAWGRWCTRHKARIVE